jgi:hypothetical protein
MKFFQQIAALGIGKMLQAVFYEDAFDGTIRKRDALRNVPTEFDLGTPLIVQIDEIPV